MALFAFKPPDVDLTPKTGGGAEKRKDYCTIRIFAFPSLRSWRYLRLNLNAVGFNREDRRGFAEKRKD